MGIIDLLKDIPLSAVLREKIIGLESENAILRSENESLKVQLNQSEEKRRALEKQIVEKSIHSKFLEKSQLDILLLLAKSSADESEVIESLGCGKESARFDLVELADAGLIEHKNLFLISNERQLPESSAGAAARRLPRRPGAARSTS